MKRLLALVINPKSESLVQTFELEGFVIHTSTTTAATATLPLKIRQRNCFLPTCVGDGPVDAT